MRNFNITIFLAVIVALLTTANINAQTTKSVETFGSYETIRPGNMAITKSGRMFVTINPLMGSDVRVYEMNSNGENVPYPNNKYSKGENSIIKAIIGIRADSKDNLWLLDMGAKQFVVWDTKKEELVKILAIPANVIKETSFLQDFILDEKHNRVIIADMTQGDLVSAPTPAFIVIDTKTGEAKRMAESHTSMMPDFKGGFALNPIGIDSKFKWVYFGALHSKQLYRVPAKSFDNNKNLSANIEEFAPKSYSDGILIGNKENVYVTNLEKQAIGLSNKAGYKVIANLPEGQTWPDGMCFGTDNYVYCTVDQLGKAAAFNNGKEEGKAPFLIVRTKRVE